MKTAFTFQIGTDYSNDSHDFYDTRDEAMTHLDEIKAEANGDEIRLVELVTEGDNEGYCMSEEIL